MKPGLVLARVLSVAAAVSFLGMPCGIGATVDPEIGRAARGLRNGERVPVVVRLALSPGQAAFAAALPPGPEAVGRIRDRAARAARPVLDRLDAEERRGLVSDVRLLWVAGAVTARIAPSLVATVASLPAVDSVWFDGPAGDDLDGDQSGPAPLPTPRNASLLQMNVDKLWSRGYTGKNIVVAHIDSGANYNHLDLADHIWVNPGEIAGNGLDDDGNGYVDDVRGWNFALNDPAPTDPEGHGALTAGIVAGDGRGGAQTGVAPDVELMILRRDPARISSFLEASQYAISKGADVIVQCLSIRRHASPVPDYAWWRDLVAVELAAGIVRVQSAGNNSSTETVPYMLGAPANSPAPVLHAAQAVAGGVASTISVGNVDANGNISERSSYGPCEWTDLASEDPSYPYAMKPEYRDYPHAPEQGLLKPDVVAYGDATYTTNSVGNSYTYLNGTSAAAAHVGGIAALLKSAVPSATPAQVAQALFTTASDRGGAGFDFVYGEGIVNAEAALDRLLELTDPCTGHGGDADHDGVCQDVDNCPGAANAGQADRDGDGSGDACDADADGDGVEAAGGDCDDLDVSVFPGALEVCNAKDDDCDAGIDENPEAAASCADSDPCTADACAAGGTCAHAPSCVVGGRVTYYREGSVEPSSRGVGSVVVEALRAPANAPSLGTASTGAGGTYELAPLSGDVTVTPRALLVAPRADAGAEGSISAHDATLVSHAAVGLTVLGALQSVAADVTGNGTVSSYDAALVAQYSAGIFDHFPVALGRASDWLFVRCDGGVPGCPAWPPLPPPPSYAYVPLAGPQTADFLAVLFGDVSGNWPNDLARAADGAPASAAPAADGAPKFPVEAAAPTAPAEARRAPMTAPRPGAGATLRLAAGPRRQADGSFVAAFAIDRADGILALDLAFEHLAPVMRVTAVRPVGIAAGWHAALAGGPGATRAGLHGVVPLAGSGVVFEVVFIDHHPFRFPFALDASANEGLVPLTVALDRPSR